MRIKKIFLPICWITELYYSLRYNSLISGHDFVEQNNGSLKCEICGEVSK